MSKLPIFEHFLSVMKYQAKTQVVFQAKTQAKYFQLNWAPAPRQRRLHEPVGVLARHRRTGGLPDERQRRRAVQYKRKVTE